MSQRVSWGGWAVPKASLSLVVVNLEWNQSALLNLSGTEKADSKVIPRLQFWPDGGNEKTET